jgi:hypothetical protein
MFCALSVGICEVVFPHNKYIDMYFYVVSISLAKEVISNQILP